MEEMTEDYKFLFSLYPYDLIHIESKSKNMFGYYKTIDISDSRLKISFINNNSMFERISCNSAIKLNKYTVDILGNYHIVKKEKRQWKTKIN